ncbi:MAG: sigma-54-dependent Fis family transcriptional regulator [Planctomycetaceae bacterium]|nr:sigma-54-dependent Fis family transcriptional regulator [Planctomycetaceae bacterium]|tara:strand:+ start:1680 stop:3704 length:2025 start_codon:yes stop_codon:yes gene_type:complete
MTNQSDSAASYLVVRDGNQWRDVFRLMPGQVTTVGRSSTNRVVVRDEVCSRNHCEVFQSGDRWLLRDLSSRNGTLVNGVTVEGDWPLEEGQIIQIGNCDLGFTSDLLHAFPEPESTSQDNTADTAEMMVFDDPSPESEPEIVDRRRENRFRDQASTIGGELDGEPGTHRTSRDLTSLYRLALDMGAARDAEQLAHVVLDGLFAATRADIGAVLLLPKGLRNRPRSDELRVAAYRSVKDLPYQKVSDYLSSTVLVEAEAVLARDVADDSKLVDRDSLGQIHAQSVICAPLIARDVTFGVIHLYSTDSENLLESNDLEFSLAVADQLAVALDGLQDRESLVKGLAQVQGENESLRSQLAIDSELVGDSEQMDELRGIIERIASTDATVLVRGESGVGKELVARAIHFRSRRRHGPFVCMNCAALSESLLESELFGHEKGAFTGATDRKPGKFEQSDGGTLFLDEVGEMPPAIQAKFLRALEGHPFERVGGRTAVDADVRVVAATNRDLEEAVAEGTFRKDLYYRLFVVEIQVAPLRDHAEDIVQLAHFFCDQFVKKSGREISGFTPGALAALKAYDWPGNVRELRNAVERTVILCAGDQISEADIQLSTLATTDESSSSSSVVPSGGNVSLETLEQQHILAVLESTEWNKSQAARILGIERSTLDRKLKRYQVSRP